MTITKRRWLDASQYFDEVDPIILLGNSLDEWELFASSFPREYACNFLAAYNLEPSDNAAIAQFIKIKDLVVA